MSSASGPNIVTDGLVAYLDAANPKSFLGEPTTNYVDAWMDGTFAPWSSWSDGGGAGTYDLLTDYPYGYKVRFTNTANAGRYSLSIGDSLGAGGKRTFSVYVKPLSWNNAGSYLDIYCDYAGGGGPYYHTGIIFYLSTKTVVANYYVENIFCNSVGDGWYRIGFTTSFSDGTSGGIYPILYDNSVIEVAHPQLELKDHVTPFVDGTRGSSYVTGGGWQDLSGNNNHGTLNSNTFDSRNLGSITFNGTYVDLGMSNISYTKSTICFWVNFSTITGETGNAATIFGSQYWSDNNFSITQHATDYALMFTVGVNNYAFLGAYGGTDPAFSSIGKWYHFAFSYDSTQGTWANALKMYRDGQILSPAYGGSPQTLRTTMSIVMGVGNWRGLLNLVGFYNTNLSSDEIIRNYNATKSRYI